MRYAAGEARELPLRPSFDRQIKLEFHGARITSEGGLLAYRELDAVLGLTEIAIVELLDGRRGKNARHTLCGLFRQSVFGRLAGYEDVNDAERLASAPAMRAIVGSAGLDRAAASSSQMGRFETEWLATDANLEALTNLSGAWIDRVHEQRPPRTIVLDMDSSESPTHGEQEGFGLEWPLRLHLLSPALPVQPVRRPGTLPPAARQRPQCRRSASYVTVVTPYTSSPKLRSRGRCSPTSCGGSMTRDHGRRRSRHERGFQTCAAISQAKYARDPTNVPEAGAEGAAHAERAQRRLIRRR